MARKGRDTEMAVDTQEVNGETEEQTSKRERVDLESLDANERVMLSIAVPAGLKLALIKAGESDNLAGTAYARNILAAQMNYEIPASFTERTRTSKYGSEEERKEAYKAKAKSQRETVKAMLAALKADPSKAAALGIDVSALG